VKKLVGVIVGCGAIAREHLAVLSNFKDVDVGAVCDISPVRAEATAERFGIKKWYTDHKELISDLRPDLVHITTPPSSHVSITKDCLAEGLNVLCEKPITIEYSDFEALRDLASEKKLILMENQQNKFHSCVLKIFDLVHSGKLGDILEVQILNSINLVGDGSPYNDANVSHFSSSLPGGPIGDFLPHIAYLAYMFTGEVLEVRTIWEKRVGNTSLRADEFRGLIKGARASAYVSFNGTAKVEGFWLRVVGTKMRVETNLYEPPRFTVRRFRSGEPSLMTLLDGIAESRDGARGSVTGFVRKLAGRSSYDGLEELLSRTYRAIELNQPQPISLKEINDTCLLKHRLSRLESSL
jgi:predicted dehydrogenase